MATDLRTHTQVLDAGTALLVPPVIRPRSGQPAVRQRRKRTISELAAHLADRGELAEQVRTALFRRKKSS